MPFVIISGLSGSGKSTALRALEDGGFFTTDNLPPALWNAMSELARAEGLSNVAISTDARTRNFLHGVEGYYRRLLQKHGDVRVIFLDTDEEVLLGRYNLTRREHPLGEHLLLDVARERELLAPMRAIADNVLDTSALSAAELAARLREIVRPEQAFSLRLMSFGFKHTPPRDVDLVLDVRTLPNPHYDPELRPKTGLQEDVARYVFAADDSQAFYAGLRDFVRSMATRAREQGRHGYSVGIGCTGGQHRSVAVTERLARDLADLGAQVALHRDMPDYTPPPLATLRDTTVGDGDAS